MKKIGNNLICISGAFLFRLRPKNQIVYESPTHSFFFKASIVLDMQLDKNSVMQVFFLQIREFNLTPRSIGNCIAKINGFYYQIWIVFNDRFIFKIRIIPMNNSENKQTNVIKAIFRVAAFWF